MSHIPVKCYSLLAAAISAATNSSRLRALFAAGCSGPGTCLGSLQLLEDLLGAGPSDHEQLVAGALAPHQGQLA